LYVTVGVLAWTATGAVEVVTGCAQEVAATIVNAAIPNPLNPRNVLIIASLTFSGFSMSQAWRLQ
jgi:hypothetical protein